MRAGVRSGAPMESPPAAPREPQGQGDEDRLPRPSGQHIETGGEHPGHGQSHGPVRDVDVEMVRAVPPPCGDEPGDAVERDADHHHGQAVGEPGRLGHALHRFQGAGPHQPRGRRSGRTERRPPIRQDQEHEERSGIGVGGRPEKSPPKFCAEHPDDKGDDHRQHHRPSGQRRWQHGA